MFFVMVIIVLVQSVGTRLATQAQGAWDIGLVSPVQ